MTLARIPIKNFNIILNLDISCASKEITIEDIEKYLQYKLGHQLNVPKPLLNCHVTYCKIDNIDPNPNEDNNE